MDKERKMSILRYYRRMFENHGWPWRINERWLKRTVQEVRFLATYFSKEDKILDAGCGTGRHIIELHKGGYLPVGIDISGEMLSIAKKKLWSANIDEAELIRADAAHLPFADSSFDHAISMYNVFLELPSEKERLEALRQMKRVIKTSGYIVIDLPYIDPSWKSSDQLYETISLEDRDFWELAFDGKKIVDKVFIHYVDREEIVELIKTAGLEFTESVDKQWCDKSRRIITIAKKL